MKPKLLVVELWNVGDLAIATPFLRAACEKFSVTLLAKPQAVELQKRFWPEVEVVPFIAPWTVFHHKYRLYAWPWGEMLRLRKALGQRQFDVGISARWDPRNHVVLKFVGAKKRVGFPRIGSGLFLTDPLPAPGPRDHRYENWRRVARAVGIELPPRNELTPRAANSGELILVHTGARLPARVWPLDYYRTVVRRLRAEGRAVQVACDANQSAWWRQAGEIDVACPQNIGELVLLIERARVFVGNCSGPGHLAAISGVPTFTLFGPSLPEWFAPLHPAAEWIEGQPCPYRPCDDYCRFGLPRCLTELPEETVWPRVRDFITRHVGEPQGTVEPIPTEPNRTPVAVEPVRVLCVNNSADIYGGSRMLLRFLTASDRRHLEPLVVLPEEGLLKEFLAAHGVEVVLHPKLSVITRPVFHSWRLILFLLNFPLSVLFLWRLIRRRKIDLVYTNTGVTISPALAAKLAGVPHVWHIREWFQEFSGFWPVYARYITKWSRRVIAVSNAIAGQFKPPGSAVVVHDGFALEEFQVPKQRLGDEFRAKYRLGNAFVVGCVGRIKYVRKGQEILVQATAILKKRGRCIKALIVGAPFPRNEIHLKNLEGLVQDQDVADAVVLTGELTDTRPAYAAMNLLALTSAQPEPFGGVVMEAMAMELPVIATNIGGSVDQVVDGVTGLLIPPGDPAALADAVEKLMNDPELCRRMGRAAVQRVAQDFSLTEMTLTMSRHFDEVVAEQRKEG